MVMRVGEGESRKEGLRRSQVRWGTTAGGGCGIFQVEGAAEVEIVK
jgi:hypothetical protein